MRDRDGRIGHGQAKAYAAHHNPSMRDLTQFVSGSALEEDDPADYLVLFTTSDDVSVHARKVVKANGIAVHTYADLIEVECWEPGTITLPDPLTPRDYQYEAIKALVASAERGKCILPTGTGKSLIQAEVAKAHDSVLIMVPSIELIPQMIGMLRPQDPTRAVLAVVSKADKDEHNIKVENTTDAGDVTKFLTDVDRPLVIATYQSGRALIKGARGFVFDLIMYDEAHRTAGAVAKRGVPLFKRTLTDVAARKRRFFTATPRIHDAALKDALEHAGALSFSMDDEDIYGETLYTKTAMWAIKNEHLSPFSFVVPIVTSASLMEQIERNGWTDELDKDTEDLDAISDLSTVVFTLKTVADQGIARVLTFHNRVEKAQRAARLFEKVGALMGLPVNAVSVSAESSKKQRTKAKRMLKAKSPTGINIVCNVNLFGEGIDTPALDAIVYFDSKSSAISIVQSIGRALRPDKDGGKEQAFILLPVFIPEGEDMDDSVRASRFDTLYSFALGMRDLGIDPEQIDTMATTDAIRVGGDSEFHMDIPVPEGWDIEAVIAGIKSMMVHGTWKAPTPLGVALDAARREWASQHVGRGVRQHRRIW